MCDFNGFVVPEMIKVRPVVVLAANKRNKELVTVVPLSTTAPAKLEEHHHELSRNPLPDKQHLSCWAKCDMVVTVSLHRLDRYKLGTRDFRTFTISDEDFLEVQRGVVSALSLSAAVNK